jgi:hypothetical protein
MHFNSFLETYDHPGSIILFGGKRDVPPSDERTIIQLGILLASSSKRMLFRSGNAGGSDELFSKGVSEISNARLQVITPYEGHRAKNNVAYDTISLDQVNIVAEPDVVGYSLRNQSSKSGVKSYVQGNRDRYAMKGAYIIRDTVMVIGANGIPKANFALFYDDLENPMTGGTGHTMDVCGAAGIPSIDQKVWLSWL